jgi:hypothetical protein
MGAALLGGGVLSLPTLGTLGLLVAKGAAPTLTGPSLLVLVLAAALGCALALWLAALLEDTGFTALAALLFTLGALWLDARGGLEVLRAAREGAVSVAALAILGVVAGALLVLAALQASPVATGERLVVRSRPSQGSLRLLLHRDVGALLVLRHEGAAAALPGQVPPVQR